MESLDRFLANEEWLLTYPDAKVIHLTRTHLDYCPLLISTLSNKPPSKNKIFRFETMCSSHRDLPSIINNAWISSTDLPDAIHTFEKSVTICNKSSFGNVFHQKRTILR